MRIITTNLATMFRNPSEALRYVLTVQASLDKSIRSGKPVLAGKVMTVDFNDTNDGKVAGKGAGSGPSSTDIKKSGSKGKSTFPSKVPGFKVADTTIKRVHDLTVMVHHYEALVRELKARSVEWRKTFEKNSDVKPLLAETNNTITRAQNAYDKARKTLAVEAEKILPKEFQTVCTKIEQALAQRLEFGKYDTETHMYHVENRTLIVNTLTLHDLASIDDTLDIYRIVITCVNSDGNVTTHVTTHHEHEEPGTYDPGNQFSTVEEALEIIDTLMELDRFDAHLFDAPMPISEKEVDAFDLGDYKKHIGGITLNRANQTIELRTKTFLNADALKPVLESVMSQFPSSLHVGKVKFVVTAEVSLRIELKNGRELTDELMDSFATDYDVSDKGSGFYEVNVRDDSTATLKVCVSKMEKKLNPISKDDLEASAIHNLVSFRMSGTKRTDIRMLREFTDNLSEYLTAEQIKKVRKALGV